MLPFHQVQGKLVYCIWSILENEVYKIKLRVSFFVYWPGLGALTKDDKSVSDFGLQFELDRLTVGLGNNLLLIASDAIGSLFGILSERDTIQNAFTVRAFETLWMINLTSSTQNTSFDCFTALAAFFKRLKIWYLRFTAKMFVETFDFKIYLRLHSSFGSMDRQYS